MSSTTGRRRREALFRSGFSLRKHRTEIAADRCEDVAMSVKSVSVRRRRRRRDRLSVEAIGDPTQESKDVVP